MQQLGSAHHPSAVRNRDRLMSEAHPEQRHAPRGSLYQLEAGARAFRHSRPRAQQDAVDRESVEVARTDVVVASYDALRTELADVRDEVVDEAVVVVDDEDPRHFSLSFVVFASSSSRSIRRSTLPTSDCGSASRNSTCFGTLYAVSNCAQCSTRSLTVRSASLLRTT